MILAQDAVSVLTTVSKFHFFFFVVQKSLGHKTQNQITMPLLPKSSFIALGDVTDYGDHEVLTVVEKIRTIPLKKAPPPY